LYLSASCTCAIALARMDYGRLVGTLISWPDFSTLIQQHTYMWNGFYCPARLWRCICHRIITCAFERSGFSLVLIDRISHAKVHHQRSLVLYPRTFLNEMASCLISPRPVRLPRNLASPSSTSALALRMGRGSGFRSRLEPSQRNACLVSCRVSYLRLIPNLQSGPEC